MEVKMRVIVYSDDGNELFRADVGSKRKCDGNNCYPVEVKDALMLAWNHGELPKWRDLTWLVGGYFFYPRRQRDREARAD
jgi:hypothetical protein